MTRVSIYSGRKGQFVCARLVLSAMLLAAGGCAVDAADNPDKIAVAQGSISVQIVSSPPGVSREQILNWIQTASRAVSTYCGRFPVKHLELAIGCDARGSEIHGRQIEGRRIELNLGVQVTADDLTKDWVLTHEMFHLAFPDLDESHLWMNEGLSDYLEPIARSAIGSLTPRQVWKETVEGMPQGLPEPGDRGLDRTHTWGRTYWGGCLYWLLADIQIRQRTDNRKSLRDAIRAILNAGGDGSAHWSVARVLEVGDQATGTTVLQDLYDRMAAKPAPVDLDKLWKELGIVYRDGQVTFDDTAPLAKIRDAITSGK